MADQNSLNPIKEGEEKNPAEKMEQKPESAEAKEIQAEKIPTPEQSPERKEGVAEKEDAYAKILSKVTDGKTAKDEEVSLDAEIAMRQKDAEAKVNNLVSPAETKGVAHAVKVARHMEDNYILDEFHDKLLSDELHEFLAKKGLIKEI